MNHNPLKSTLNVNYVFAWIITAIALLPSIAIIYPLYVAITEPGDIAGWFLIIGIIFFCVFIPVFAIGIIDFICTLISISNYKKFKEKYPNNPNEAARFGKKALALLYFPSLSWTIVSFGGAITFYKVYFSDHANECILFIASMLIPFVLGLILFFSLIKKADELKPYLTYPNNPFYQNVQYSQRNINNPYNQNYQYGQVNPYNQNNQLGQNNPYSQNNQFGQNNSNNQISQNSPRNINSQCDYYHN